MDKLNLPLRLLGPKLLAVALLVAALLWGAWLTQQVTSAPKQRIVTVRLAGTIGTFVEEAARADADPAVVQAASLAYLKAAESAVADMGHVGRVVLELLVRGEGVLGARHEQHGNVDVRKVVGAQRVGLARRMERIAEQHEPGHRLAGGRQHRAHPTAEGTTADEQRGRILADAIGEGTHVVA